MDKVKQMVNAGVSVGTAIKEVLGQSVTAWADKNSLSRPITSEVLNCERAPKIDVCRALERDLGGDAYDWALLLWEGAKPNADAFADVASSTNSNS